MTTIAFIGLGVMGGPMAANLVRAGFDVIGHNRSPEAVDRLISAVLDRKAEGMRARSFAPGFRIALHDKDMRIVADAARGVGVVLPVGGLITALTASATAQGWGDLDHTVVLRLIAQLSGRA